MIWGSNFVAMKYLIGEIGALHVLLVRVLLASSFFGILLLITQRSFPRFSWPEWRLLIMVGFFGVVTNQLTVSYGTSYLSAALASMIVTSNPIFVAIISRLLLGARLTPRKLLGIAIAVTGFFIVLLFGGGSAEFSVTNVIGVFITACAPLSWAISTVISKPLMVEYDPKLITGLSSVIAGIIVLPVIISQPGLFTEMAAFDGKSWLAAFATSIMAVAVAYTIWYRGLRKLEPTQVAIYVYLVPFFGVLFAWLLLGETITIFVLLGGATILTGVIITNTARQPAPEQIPEIVDESTLADRTLRRGESHIGK